MNGVWNKILRPGKGGARKVLLVDDESDIRNLLTKFLRPVDCEVHGAASADEALAMLERETYRLVVLDIVMPGMSGVELVKKLRKHNWLARVPVLLISGNVVDEDLDEYRRIFPRLEVMHKPIEMGPFRETVAQALKTGFAELDIPAVKRSDRLRAQPPA